MNRKLTKFFVFTITILIAHLVSDFLVEMVLEHSVSNNVYKETAIRLLITVFIFYPVLMFTEKYMKDAARRYVNSSKKLAKSSIYGMLIGSAVAIIILYGLFLMLWYNTNMVRDFLNLIGM